MILTLLEVFILGHYSALSTGRIQQLAYNTNHRQGATKLLKLLSKYLLMHSRSKPLMRYMHCWLGSLRQ